jgi:hypothetical protein
VLVAFKELKMKNIEPVALNPLVESGVENSAGKG